MNILVTGGAGLIGSHLTEALISLGHNVTVIDNLTTGTKENLASVINNPLLHYIEGDILDNESIHRIVPGHDLIFHMAAAVGVKVIMEQPLQSMLTNIEGTKNILEAADKHKIKTFIASTSEVYGKNTKMPFSEDDDRTMGATTKLRWHYAESKALDEFLALAYHDERGLPVVITRFFNTTGERQSADYGMVVPKFIEKAQRNEPIPLFGDGSQQRCFSYVGDIVEALILLMDCEAAVGQVINLGNTEEMTIRELANLIIEMTGSTSEIIEVDPVTVYGKRFEDMPRRVPDLTKITHLTGWKPTTTMRTIVEKFYDSSTR
jgi:UDP-glucose 4-epimerase